MEDCMLNVGEAFLREMSRKRQKSSGEVVMVIRRPEGKVLLSTKEFYPSGTYRLPSGQIEVGESPEDVLAREAVEETGLAVRSAVLLSTIHYKLRSGSEMVDYVSHVFLTEETRGEPSPQDPSESITGFREADPCDLADVASQLEDLPEPWHDWGRFRAVAHRFVCRKLCPSSDL